MNPSREETLFAAALAKAPGDRVAFLDGASHAGGASQTAAEFWKEYYAKDNAAKSKP